MELKGAEIFAIGSWNGREFSQADLDGIVSSFEALGLAGRVPLKQGHDGGDARDGDPALGWVTRVWREGERLLADFKDVPAVVYEGIRKGLYKFVSVELLRNVKADTRLIAWVLDAVALLGATQPAVGILKDLQALTLARSTGLRCEGRVAFRRDTSSGGNQAMSEELKRELDELRTKFAAEQTRAATAVADAKLAAERADKVEMERKAEKVKAARTTIDGLFNAAIEAKRILPADREQYNRTTKYQTNDERVLEIDPVDVTAHIDRIAGPEKKERKTTMTKQNGTEPEIPEGATPDQELDIRVTAECYRRNVDPKDSFVYQRVSADVMRAHPELARAWQYMPDERFAANRR